MHTVATINSRQLVGRRLRELLLLAGHSVRTAAHQIGWLPWQAYDQAHADGRLVGVCRDGELVGFCLHSLPDPTCAVKIWQTWVRPDARRIEHGLALVDRVQRQAWDLGARRLECRVAEDLEAMRFWPAIGFKPFHRSVGRGDLVQLAARGRAPRELVHFTRALEAREWLPNDPTHVPPLLSCGSSEISSSSRPG